MNNGEVISRNVKELCKLDMGLYKCVAPNICTDRVVLTERAMLHIAEHHPEAYNEVLIELKETIINPDYIIKDEKHIATGLVIKAINSRENVFIVLRIVTESDDNNLANYVVSGWKISKKRLKSYLKNKELIYKAQ